MGLLRLFLASLVLISHLGISVAGVNPGVSAVAIFYLLAGRVVSRLWREQPERGVISGGMWFYRDRLWRILPLYMFALIVALIVWLLGASSPFLLREPEMTDWLANLLIVPLSYYMYSGQDAFTLLPPAWSLGVELQFYLLVPLLLSRPLWAVVFSALSFLTFSSAQLGWLDTDVFGYRLLAGIGFVFMLGVLLDRPSRLGRLWIYALWLVSALYVFWLLGWGTHVPYNLEVALGIALGVPILLVMERRGSSRSWRWLQRTAGELSYGVFLLHFPVIWALQLLGFSGPRTVLAVWLASAGLAWLGHRMVERPVWRLFRPRLPGHGVS